MTPEIAQELGEEVRLIHNALFRGAPSEELVLEYIEAHKYLSFSALPGRNIFEAALKQRLDLEAIELVTRKLSPLLSRKMWLCLYLCETRAEYQSMFVQSSPNRLEAWVVVLRESLRVVGKYVKGHYLLRRHSLV